MFGAWFRRPSRSGSLTQKVRFRPTVERLEELAAPGQLCQPFFIGGSKVFVFTNNVNTNTNTNVNVNVNSNVNIINININTAGSATPVTTKFDFAIARVPGRIQIQAVEIATGNVTATYRILHEGEPRFSRVDINGDGATDLVVVFRRNGRTHVRAFSGADGTELAVFVGRTFRAGARAAAGG